MFTGIIQAIGKIVALDSSGEDQQIRVHTGKLPLSDVALGDSIAVNGVCLTVIELTGDGFWADVSGETVKRTTLGILKPGANTNLEKAVTPETHLGGHIVSGHVDGIGKILSRESSGRSIQFLVEAPHALGKYIAEKGSICIDGISLTVNEVDGPVFKLTIVPHTLAETIMSDYNNQTKVNLEVDIIARYLERLISYSAEEAVKPDLSMDKLLENGFA